MEDPWKFWIKVDKRGPDECWPWKGARKANGYGSCWNYLDGKGTTYPHRIAWRLEHGGIPAGQQVDHLCHNTLCVNVRHLELVSQSVNLLRRVAHMRGTCGRGHPYDEANTYVDLRGRRVCRACRALAAKKWRAAHPPERAPFVPTLPDPEPAEFPRLSEALRSMAW